MLAVVTAMTKAQTQKQITQTKSFLIFYVFYLFIFQICQNWQLLSHFYVNQIFSANLTFFEMYKKFVFFLPNDSQIGHKIAKVQYLF